MSEETQNNLNDRVTELEVSMTDVKVSLNRLIDFSYENQRTVTNAIERLAEAQTQTLRIVEEMQSEIRGLQTENRRILGILINEDESSEGEN
jgi:hypothetical protein